jgi:hypothetical protein
MTAAGSFYAYTGNQLFPNRTYFYRVKALISADGGNTIEQINGWEQSFTTGN